MKYIIIFIILSGGISSLSAQQKDPGFSNYRGISFSVLNNSFSLPFTGTAGILYAPVHPGFELGYCFNYASTAHHDWFQNLKTGLVYDRLVQTCIPVFGEAGYRYKFNNGLALEGMLQLGYMHSFTNVDVFKLNENGEYEKAGQAGYPHVMFGYNLGLSYNLEKKTNIPLRAFFYTGFRIMTPFVTSYVPFQPNSTLQIGVYYHLKGKTKN